MTPRLPKYLPRSARYILKAKDQTLVRLAGPNQDPWEESTEIKNISLSGLSFVAPQDLCPIVGELIRVEFEMPKGPQTACWALVTRQESTTKKNFLLIGVQFTKLTAAQKMLLNQSLSVALQEQATDQQRKFQKSLGHLRFLPYAILFFCMLLIWWELQ